MSQMDYHAVFHCAFTLSQIDAWFRVQVELRLAEHKSSLLLGLSPAISFTTTHVHELFLAIEQPTSVAAQIAFYTACATWLPQTKGWPGHYPILPVDNHLTTDLQYLLTLGPYVTQAQVIGPVSYAPVSIILRCFHEFYNLAAAHEEILESSSGASGAPASLHGGDPVEDFEYDNAADYDPYPSVVSTHRVTIY
ncbi:hypothetical protein C8J56DRAFT_1038082 [Mycena floridula]|nr:hypothetical protein C8J56DRAFT_1038082 [Mycena floridula]